MKPLKEDIPVEPLSEARWKKLDDSVFAALDAGLGDPTGESIHPPSTGSGASSAGIASPRRRTQSTLFLVSGFAVAAVVLAFVLRAVLSPEKGELLVNPSHIETGAEPSRLAIGESSIDVSANSAVVASGDAEHGVLVVLEKGRVECEVAPRKGRPPFVVQAGDVRVRVIGTRFAVERNARDIRVKVSHGTVEVTGASEVILLHDGDTWPSNSATSATPATSAAQIPPSAVVTADLPSAQKDLAPPTPSAAVTPSGAPSVALPASSPQVTDQRAYEGAARLEAKDPEAAMGTYKRLAGSSGPWAQPSLFAAGRLAADRGRSADARKYLETYLARYPHGANAEDARRILGRLQ
jgi:hypothetical protein